MLIHTHGNDLCRVIGFSFRAFIAIVLLFAIVNASHAQQAFVTLDVSDLSGADRGEVYVTFGQVIAEGQAPTGSSVGGRIEGIGDIDLQVDEKATHGDGSMRHAVFTARLPNLAANATNTIELYSGNTDPGGGAITVANLLATAFNVTVTLTESGTPYTVSARDLLGGSVATWLNGPLASEWLVSGPVRNGGTAHPHLSVQFHVRAYSGLSSARVDVVVENTDAYASPDGQNHTYNYSIAVPGKPAISGNSLSHPIFTRWHQVVWWGTDQEVEVAHDTEYLQATGAVPNYDDDITIDSGFLGSMATSVAPLNNGDHNDDMSEGGSQDQIGPLPRWTAAYLVSGDRRAMLNMLANDGNGSGAYQIHFRDGLGTPVSIDEYPDAGTDDVGGDFNVGSPSGSPYTPDVSHHPSSGYVPYLITGDYYYLEEIQFWANYGLLDRSPDARNGSEGLLQEHQVRGRAWSMRSLGQAAYATPAGTLKDYFIDKISNNLSDWNARYNDNPGANNLGLAVPRSDEGDGEGLNVYKTWMDDYYSWAMAYLVELGFDNAAAHRDWKFKSAMGRMGSTDFCWIRAAEYSRDVGEGAGSSGTFAGSWAAIQAQLAGVTAGGTTYGSHVCGSASMGAWAAAFDDDHNGEAGELLGRSGSTTGYPVYLRIVLAAAADAGTTNADLAWQRFTQNPVQPDFSDYPTFALSPRGDVDPVVDPGVPGGSSSSSSSSGGSDDDDILGGDDSGGGGMGTLMLFLFTLALMVQRRRIMVTGSDQGGSKMSGKMYLAPALLLAACAMSLPAMAGSCPADLSSLTPGHWCEVPDSRLEDVSEVENPKVIDPWSGGVFDTDENRLIIWGGGHTDYDGNEMYAFDVDTQEWSQITDRSSPTSDSETYSDGLPSSRHTYDGIQYLPGLKWLWSSGGSTYRDGSCTNATWIYDFNAARNEGWSRISAGSGGGRCEDSSAYDPVSGHVWFWSREGLYEFDPQNLGNPWWARADERESDTYTGAVDPVRRKLVFIGEGAGFMFDITNPANVTGGLMNTGGQTQVQDVKAPGIAYDPTNDGRFVAWGGRGSIVTTDVFALDVESEVWTRYPAAAGNSTTPSSAAANGTYGRFRYVPSENVFILVNAIDENVYFYKMADSGGISDGLPVINIAVSPASIAVGGTVTVTWSVSNATSCETSGDWSGSVSLNGTQSVGPLSEERNYVVRLNCTGAGGFASREAVVAVGSSGGSSSSSSSSSSSGGPDNDPSGDDDVLGDDDGGGGAIDLLLLFPLIAVLAGSSRRRRGKTN